MSNGIAQQLMAAASYLMTPDENKSLEMKMLDVVLNKKAEEPFSTTMAQLLALFVRESQKELVTIREQQVQENHATTHPIFPGGPKGTLLEVRYAPLMRSEYASKEGLESIGYTEAGAELLAPLLAFYHDMVEASIANDEGKASNKRAREAEEEEPQTQETKRQDTEPLP